ncbi:MAG: S41 family peptidase [Acidobacteriota bacterium]
MYSKSRMLVLFVSALLVGYAVIGWMMGTVSSSNTIYKELSLFMEIYNKIQDEYVEKPDMAKSLLGALRGLTDALDPYSSFVPRENVSRVEALRPDEPSIGAAMARRYGYGYVMAPLPGSPAEIAGLRAGDTIESIDGKSTAELSLAEIEAMLHGKAGTEVALGLVRGRRSQPLIVKVRREEWKQPVLSAVLLEDRVGHLKVPYFYKGVAVDLRAKIKMLTSRPLDGLVLDLRGTPGGSIDEAITAASYFLEAGKKIAALRPKEGPEKTFQSEGGALYAGPLTVLINTSSSGAAEVLAAALADNERAVLVGDRTPGFASVQKMFRLEDGSALILSVAFYHRPNGKPLQAEQAKLAGLQPQIRVPKEDFVSRFYVDNPVESGNEQQAEQVYQKLLKAIEEMQLKEAVQALKARVINKAATAPVGSRTRRKAA